ncbi:hypothetical protein [Noviherbaspirillum sp. ST9]|uniref:hypothetical protein n=1 Tax=Noviherbaspirillum sp. ST9 TaxID=3401606 RepID=UPI003B58788F
MRRCAFIPFFLASLTTFGAHAQVLECIDSQGRKEFASVCPPGTLSQKELRAREAASAAPQQDWQAQERAFQERRLRREQAESDAEKRQLQQQAMKERCASAQRAMEQLQSGRRLRWGDKATGERAVMTDAEHAAEIKAVSEELRRCRASSPG